MNTTDAQNTDTKSLATEHTPRLGFWTFWVCVNAIASFIWALMIDHSARYLLGMFVGVAVFIVIYTMVDKYLLRNGHHRWHKALIKGVYIKAGLQLLNLGVFFALPICLEMWVGMFAVMLTNGEFFGGDIGLDSSAQPFWFAFICTLITGALLSVIVGVISLILGSLNHSTHR